MFVMDIATIRKGLGLTQAEFAQLVGVSHAYVGHLETGVRKPSINLAMRIEGLAHDKGFLGAAGLVNAVVADKVMTARQKSQAA